MKISLRFFNESGVDIVLDDQKISNLLTRICNEFDTSIKWINVIFMTSDQHTEMNRDFLGHDYPTDIITFPADSEEGYGGELYINPDVASENAESYNVTLENELNRLIIHGTLHLCGLDDKTENEQIEMSAQEDKYLKYLI